MKKFLKIYGCWILVSWAANAISEHVKTCCECLLAEKREGKEAVEGRYKRGFIWKFTFQNLKEAADSIKEYIEESK